MRPFPTLNPLIRIGLEKYLAEITGADFIDRQHNQVLPDIIRELLQIVSEARYGN